MSYKLRDTKLSAAARFVAAAVASGVVALGLLSPATAAAQPGAPVGSSDAVRQGAWDTRNNLNAHAGNLPPEAAQAVQGAVDGAVNGLFPGLIQERQGAMQPAPAAPAPAPAPAVNDFDRGPCPAHARACIDLKGERTWLQENGQVVYGAVPISSGAPGWETPTGTFRVNRKVKGETSREFNNAPMPYAVYFTNNGIAFHQGRIDWLSHGCIHLNHNDAVHYFNTLKPGDVVFVY